MKNAILIMIILMLAGCATAPGQIPVSDYDWSEIKAPISYQEAFRRIDTGFKKCDSHTESMMFTDNKTAYFYVYLTTDSKWVLGKIDIAAASENSTSVKFGVQKMYHSPVFGEPGRIRSIWEKFLDSDYKCH